MADDPKTGEMDGHGVAIVTASHTQVGMSACGKVNGKTFWVLSFGKEPIANEPECIVRATDLPGSHSTCKIPEKAISEQKERIAKEFSSMVKPLAQPSTPEYTPQAPIPSSPTTTDSAPKVPIATPQSTPYNTPKAPIVTPSSTPDYAPKPPVVEQKCKKRLSRRSKNLTDAY